MSGQCWPVGGEPHVTHLLPAERELLAECHRRRVYLAMCGAELPVAELAASLCEPGCELEITYCVQCLDDAAGQNANAGLAWSPPGTRLTVDAPAPGGASR
ncbi:MAG: hypothetical protein ACRDQ9_21020 [Pseudonocardiaceae bacterium]